MTALRIELPTIQNWNCHSCSGCCRQHGIEITEEERQRILNQRWSEEDGIASGRPVFVWFAGPPWKKRYRLAHQSDGACVFLDERGLCRIHAKFGEEAKPLPCRIYPYAFHPAGRKIAVSLRFSCPSVVANRGDPLGEQKGEIKKIARAVVPEGAENTPPPRISSTERIDWPGFLRFVDALDETLAAPNTPVVTKLLRALFWIDLVGQSTFHQIRGKRLDGFLEIITHAAAGEVSDELSDVGEPSRAGLMQFRMLVAQYARKDTYSAAERGWRSRWRLLRAGMRFARGTGDVPAMQAAFREVPFHALEQPFGGLPADADELFTRYFRVKLQGLHFCGPAYYNVPLVEGFQSLTLIFPAILWLARWLAVSEGRTTLESDDVARALAMADHHHGYSPAFGARHFRRRVRILARLGDLGKLCVHYSR